MLNVKNHFREVLVPSHSDAEKSPGQISTRKCSLEVDSRVSRIASKLPPTEEKEELRKNETGIVRSQKIVRLHRLAEQGNAKAQFKLGVYFKNGRGVAKDVQEAVRWYRLAVQLGDAKAQVSLGLMYEKGQGVEQDYQEALRLYRLAAGQGSANAQFNLGNMHRKGLGVEADNAEAVKWYQRAANQGNPDALYALAYMHHTGSGVKPDEDEAIRWLRLAAEQGSKEARMTLANLDADREFDFGESY